MSLLALSPCPPLIDEALRFLRQRGMTIVIADGPQVPSPAELVAQCDLIVLDAARRHDLIVRIREDVAAGGLPIAVWGEEAAGRTSLEEGADLWLSLSDPAETIALRLMALARRARLGGAPRLDMLTGLIGSRLLVEQLKHEFDRAHRYRRSLALLVVEPDALEEINRDSGIEAGNQALREMAQQLRTLVRDVDVIGRLSGKRFAMLLPETDGAGGVTVGERLRITMEGRLFQSPGAQATARGTRPWKITVSLGVAAVPARGMESASDLLGRALESLVQAQRRGGNRVVPFGAPEIIWSRQAPDPTQF